MSVFESRYKENLTKEVGMAVVTAAICAGISNDLGSGSNVDLCIVNKEGKQCLRNYQSPNPRSYTRSKVYDFRNGHTAVLSTKITQVTQYIQVLDAMEAE